MPVMALLDLLYCPQYVKAEGSLRQTMTQNSYQVKILQLLSLP
jgi:hypothetical protein